MCGWLVGWLDVCKIWMGMGMGACGQNLYFKRKEGDGRRMMERGESIKSHTSNAIKRQFNEWAFQKLDDITTWSSFIFIFSFVFITTTISLSSSLSSSSFTNGFVYRIL